MVITGIKVTYGLTVNLGNFQNARPEVSLTAELHSDDNADEAYAALMETARKRCEAEADRALLAAHQEPQFYDGPLYALTEIRHGGNYVLIHPNLDMPWLLARYRLHGGRLPLAESQTRASEYAKQHDGMTVLVVEDQDAMDALVASITAAREAAQAARDAEAQAAMKEIHSATMPDDDDDDDDDCICDGSPCVCGSADYPY